MYTYLEFRRTKSQTEKGESETVFNIFDPDDNYIASCEKLDHAELIVKALNDPFDLMAINQKLIEILKNQEDILKKVEAIPIR